MNAPLNCVWTFWVIPNDKAGQLFSAYYANRLREGISIWRISLALKQASAGFDTLSLTAVTSFPQTAD